MLRPQVLPSPLPCKPSHLHGLKGQDWMALGAASLNPSKPLSCPSTRLIPLFKITLESFGKWETILLWDVLISASGVRAGQTGWRLERLRGH